MPSAGVDVGSSICAVVESNEQLTMYISSLCPCSSRRRGRSIKISLVDLRLEFRVVLFQGTLNGQSLVPCFFLAVSLPAPLLVNSVSCCGRASQKGLASFVTAGLPPSRWLARLGKPDKRAKCMHARYSRARKRGTSGLAPRVGWERSHGAFRRSQSRCDGSRAGGNVCIAVGGAKGRNDAVPLVPPLVLLFSFCTGTSDRQPVSLT